MKINCSNCKVREYCGTMIASILLCRKVYIDKEKEK